MKLTKEKVYINLQGKSKEELTDLWEFLMSNGEKPYRDLECFLDYGKETFEHIGFTDEYFCGLGRDGHKNKTEVTIQQLKEILQPMGTFTPIAMKCNKEQFEAIKPKLKWLEITNISPFFDYNYLVNNLWGELKLISNVPYHYKGSHNRKVYEEWNEEIFLKACGIEVDTLEKQLQKAEAEVKRLKEEINKPKVGDWIKIGESFTRKRSKGYYQDEIKITNPELIKLLENESRNIKE